MKREQSGIRNSAQAGIARCERFRECETGSAKSEKNKTPMDSDSQKKFQRVIRQKNGENLGGNTKGAGRIGSNKNSIALGG